MESDTQTQWGDDRESFTCSYLKFSGPIQNYLKTFRFNPVTVEDLTQDTFTRFWEHYQDRYNPSGSKSWLYKTATNLALDELRRQRRSGRVICSYEVWTTCHSEYAAPPDREIALEDEELIQLAFNQLPTRSRRILYLRVVAQLTTQEISQILTIRGRHPKKEVICVLVAQARRKMRETLEILKKEAEANEGRFPTNPPNTTS